MLPMHSDTPRHPRRPPAHQSVSLRHSPPASRQLPQAPTFHQKTTSPSQSSQNAPASDKVNPPSSVSPKAPYNRYSSGESSDAGKWFESSNNNVVQSNASFADDTPFFLRNSSSGDTPPDGQVAQGDQAQAAMRYGPDLLHGGTDGSSSEDFRGVIDDLTVANKKLKQKLKKYEKLYDSHLQNDKLFEVRFHGLPDYKKKELEETLRKFAASLSDGADASLNPSALSQPPIFDQQKTFSSNPSRFAESGYASMSASGQNSSAPSNQTSNQANSADTDRRRMTKSQYNRHQQTIQSYLHDIPQGLLPKSQVPMTDASKKKLVVRRLERIFAGKRSMPGSHSQPLQQEEVAQSAASADRQEREATGQRFRSEGHREARIMPVRADDEDIITDTHTESLQRLRPNLHINEQDFSGAGSPDQRPTRPLDLDPFRAQVPSENMEYIRHLGFTPPDMETGASPQLDHGWIYLNLLINMAQLHTINVTPDFVKTAVAEYSSKFELSHDGRKIRWRGGVDESKNSSGSSSEYMSGGSPFGASGSNEYIKTGNSGSSGSNLDPERRAKRLAKAQKQKEQDKFTYTPIFFHKDESEDDEDYYGCDVGSSSYSLLQRQQPGDSSGLGSSNMHSSSTRKRRDDGPMIFYNKANFCTDLSGDLRGLSARQIDSIDVTKTRVLGIPNNPQSTIESHTSERRGPYGTPLTDVGAKDAPQTLPSVSNFHFSPQYSNGESGTPATVDFEASGIGGVHPADNFSIKVRRAYARSSSPDMPQQPPHKKRLYAQGIVKIFKDWANTRDQDASAKKRSPRIKEEILSASCKPLPSSSLPPASFLPFDSTSSCDVDSDMEDEVSSNPSTTSSSVQEGPIGGRIPVLSPVRVDNQDESSQEESSEYQSSDDGSIDLLATARQMDPTTIRESEREYDAAIAERLAECIPAGSSAATAAGGKFSSVTNCV